MFQKEVEQHVGGGGQHRIRKSWNLCVHVFLQRNALVDINISIIDMC